MKNSKFSIKKRLESFIYAFQGLKVLLQEEHNARIHALAGVCVVGFGFYWKLGVLEWLGVVLAIGFVIALEAVNSAIENMADFIHPEKHEQIKKIKDISAGAVLISAITAFTIGLLVFIPKIFTL